MSKLDYRLGYNEGYTQYYYGVRTLLCNNRKELKALLKDVNAGIDTSKQTKKVLEQIIASIDRELSATKNETPIEELCLSRRPFRALKRENINTVEKLEALSRDQLLSISGIGVVAANEISQAICNIKKNI